MELLPLPLQLNPEVPMQRKQAQDPVQVSMMPEAYTAARELLSLSVPVTLAVQEEFQPILVTAVPTPPPLEHAT